MVFVCGQKTLVCLIYSVSISMSKIPIIAFAPHPWDENEWMNRQQLLSRLGKRGWPVIYSEGALDVWHRLGERWSRSPWLNRYTEQDSVTLAHPGRILPRWRKSKLIDRAALSAHARFLKTLARTRSALQRHIALVFDPQFWPYVSALNSDFVAFHVYDVYSKMHGWDEAKEEMQRDLVTRADLISVASEAMARELPEPGPARARILHNGVDESLFFTNDDPGCPGDLQEIPRPRISNIGTVNRKVDLHLIFEIATLKPDWHWVLIGKVLKQELEQDSEDKRALKNCIDAPNIHFMGERPRNTIPQYMRQMEINTICYRIREGEWVAAGYPVKLNEYLAIGKPIVASPQEAVRKHFAHVVAIASNTAQWLQSIEDALETGGIGTIVERRATAKKNTWERRADLLEQWLFEMVNDQD